MSNENKIDVYFVDDDDMYLAYFRKRFNPSISYNLHTFNSGKKFMRHFLRDMKWHNSQKIVILDYILQTKEEPDAKTGMELLPIIKHKSPETEVIILSDKVNLDLKPTASHYTPAAFIQKEENCFTRLEEIIKKLKSRYELSRKRKQYRFAVRFFVLVNAAVVIGIILYSIFR